MSVTFEQESKRQEKEYSDLAGQRW